MITYHVRDVNIGNYKVNWGIWKTAQQNVYGNIAIVLSGPIVLEFFDMLNIYIYIQNALRVERTW